MASSRPLAALVAWALATGAAAQDRFAEVRRRMVADEVAAAGVRDPRVLESMETIPRHEFVEGALRMQAYYDMALPIGAGQTISPPFVVAYMTEALQTKPEDKVLEIGTGSGYQAAVLSPLVSEVYTIEIVPELGRRAARTLQRLGLENVHARIGDGFLGWPEAAPFDKIIVTCSPEKVPEPLVEQLAEGGRLVIPVGERYQQTLYLMVKKDGQLERESLQSTLFVPMTGAAEEKREVLPDGSSPAAVNGDFEDLEGEPAIPIGWHYQRQATVLVDEDDAPSGRNFVRFQNATPGRGAQMLQGLAVDGRRVGELLVAAYVRGRGVRAGQNPRQVPFVAVSFYDELRQEVAYGVVGPWAGDFDWRRVQKRIRVPVNAREAILRIGLHGGVGDFDVDAVSLTPRPRL